MTEGADRFVRLLENAARRADIMPPAEVSALLRRAALRIRASDGLHLEREVYQKFELVCLATESSRNELATIIVRDWLVAKGYLRFHGLDEKTEGGGVT